MSQYAICTADVLEAVRSLPDNSFDALLCDPPYGLSFMGKRWDYDVPSTETWAECLRVLKPGAPLLAFFGTRTYHRGAVRVEDAGFEIRDCLAWMYGSGFPKSLDVAKQGVDGWSGYGTALKPAFEPCVLARKPLDGTVAANVARWGVGGLAIDACRIGGESTRRLNRAEMGYCGGNLAESYETGSDAGRWPANVLLDEEAAAALDAQADASRFFYTAKASRREREKGCESLPLKSAGEVTDREDGSAGLDNPRAGAGRTSGARNHHPTVKPLALTEYLARLVMPPKPGAILVPFSGSGSEMIGALRAGWPVVMGIEREAEYVAIAESRLRAWAPGAVKVG